VTPREDADRLDRRREVARRGAAACLLAAALFPSGVEGFMVAEEFSVTPGPQEHFDVLWGAPCPDELEDLLRAAGAFAEEGKADAAGAILVGGLARCPDDPALLGGLAGVRIQQGHLAEADALATRLLRIQPDSDYGWELLAVIRYLQDDSRGALRAWGRGRPLVVRDIEVRIVGYSGPRASGHGADPVRASGITPGRPLTLAGLVRGERRLSALPAASRSRLEYRALSGGEAAVEGAVVLRAGNPFTGPALIAHGFRLLGRRVHLVSADPLGRLEQWELDGTVEGTLRRGTLALAHPAPGGVGVWRWEVDHRVGRYGSAGHEAVVREERTGVGWSHTHWVTASLHGKAHTRIDLRPGRGTFGGAGVGWTFLPLNERSSITAEGTGWVRIDGKASADRDPGDRTRFGRMDIRASVHPSIPPAVGAPAGMGARFGVVAISSGVPPDLVPRIGAGGNAALLMRARSDLDSEGVVRPIFPGSAWIHGGVEFLRPVWSVGPVGIGVAAFADGVRVLASDRRSVDPAARDGAVHLGAGVRARIPGVDGWLRVDWGIDPADGASRLSAAWVQGGPG
jgi:hypothetical protein